MANDSSLQGGATHFAFDLDSQKGVTNLLASVRASAISPAQKNELRDLIFLYSNGGRDQSVRITLEQKISTYAITVLVVASKSPVVEVVKPMPVFGTSRPAPSFVPTSKAMDAAKQTIPTPLPVKEVVMTVPEVVVPTTEPVEMPAPVQVEVLTQSPTPTPEPVVQTPVVSETPKSVVAPVTETVSYDQNQALSRIREIKSLVNDKVGNPVNLVDINNDVGREYMGALLDAMKKLNSGTSVISAMKRLEIAYQLVEDTISKHDKEVEANKNLKAAEVVNPVTKTVTMPVDVSVAKKIPESSTRKLEPVMPAQSIEQTIPAPVQEVPTYPAQPEILPATKVEINTPPAVYMPRPVTVLQEPKLDPVMAPEPVKLTPTEPEITTAWGSEIDTVPVKNNDVSHEHAIGKVSSLAHAKIKLHTPNDLPLASSLETSSIAGDTLHTNQVDEGLNQLLSEWSLFKKSGLFGTGAKGYEHPLFKKIAGLQIPLLLAGRFEGATQEIKQSITDYMNGWRYEQGIIYEQGETFEHYLRRVIRHILDLHLK